MYYIYHIENLKVGCTNNPVKRIKTQQGYSNYKILAKTKCIDEASRLEFEWQDKLGYKRDIRTYKETINNFKTSKLNQNAVELLKLISPEPDEIGLVRDYLKTNGEDIPEPS